MKSVWKQTGLAAIGAALSLTASLVAAAPQAADTAGGCSIPPREAIDLKEPKKLVQETTERVLELARKARENGTDLRCFQHQIEALMGQVVDFQRFARGVMGKYASMRQYQALESAEAKAAFRQRVERFADTFEQGLLNTYAKSLLTVQGTRIEVQPQLGGNEAAGYVSVVQHIYGDNGERPYVVQYSLRRGRDQAWQVRNVMIEGINLGQTYRNQFYAAAERYNGDIDKVIEHWQVTPDAVAKEQEERDE